MTSVYCRGVGGSTQVVDVPQVAPRSAIRNSLLMAHIGVSFGRPRRLMS
jgi:hypothetical protein